MKHLILLLSSACIVCSSTASGYKARFNAWLNDGLYEQADSILSIWEAEMPLDQELYAARYNYWLNRARSAMLILSPDIPQGGESLILRDSSGNEAGAMYESVTWNDTLVHRAFAEIDRGISAFPDRIDFRLGKAAGASMTEKWDTVFTTFSDVIDYSQRHKFKWRGENNEPIPSDDARQLVADAALRYIGDLHYVSAPATDSLATRLCDKALTLFPRDFKILNIAGAIHYSAKDIRQALKYFKRAHKINPDDALILTNIAYLHYQQGDTAKALKTYGKIAESPTADEESRTYAAKMIEELSIPVKDMRMHDYFFQWLPALAQFITVDHDNNPMLSDPSVLNSVIMAQRHYKSPFRDNQISVDTLSHNNQTIYIWQFPEPEQCPLCLYVAFVPVAEGYQIFSLEKSIYVDFMVGTQQKHQHSSFFDTERPESGQEFARLLIEHGLIK